MMKKTEITREDINPLIQKLRNDLFDLLKQGCNENGEIPVHKNVYLFIDGLEKDHVYVDYISFKEEVIHCLYEDESYAIEFEFLTLDELYNLIEACYL